jgi:DNA polymerase III delta prime subunit
LSLVTNSISIIAPGEGAGDVVVNDGSSASQSPIKAGHSIEKMNELAAEARRERKVLDLEITNSSLEAINRTLEREMRKVTAELRRYRRLSRSGRFSIASTTVEESSATLTIDDMIGPVLSDMSEEEDEKEESEVSEEESPDEGTLSPDAMAEHDLKHRTRDENRLQLDLTNHQQLLIDSQKMNQSLKRCLGWSETMINEGKKALEYRVRITDVALGGRVLAPDEVEQEEDEEEENEGMSEFGAQMLRAARERAAGVEVVTWGSEGSVDRDSGIELDGSQREST